jgi:hypothetical protein
MEYESQEQALEQDDFAKEEEEEEEEEEDYVDSIGVLELLVGPGNFNG